MIGRKMYNSNVNLLPLKSIELFSLLSDAELAEISSKISVKKFKKNEVILHEEDTSEYMYIILSGKVKVLQVTEEGRETILAFHGSGDFFGEMSLIDGKTVPASVAAIENSEVAIISKNDFYALLFVQNKVLVQLLRIFCARIRGAYERIQILSFNNAAQRVKTLLMMLADMNGQVTEKGTMLNIKLTHQNIADMTGITRETVTRILNKAQKDGDIFFEGKTIFLSKEYLQKDFIIKK